MNANVYWLGSYASQQSALVGGKASQLGRLAGRYPVPHAFCLPAQAAVPALSGGLTLSPAWRRQIRWAYRRLCAGCGQPDVAVAVRSSAVDEDGHQASFAGMHESYLNVCGETAVLQAVQRCLDSAAGERVRAYRRRAGLAPTAPVAVLVQQFIHADASCVVFSADPVSGERNRILINAVWGLGESLVGGLVTPDLYCLDKASGRLLEQQIAAKTHLTIPAADGVRLAPAPRSLQHEPALSPAQLQTLAALARALEAAQGWAVDLECSFAAGRLYLLQCRPITTLALQLPNSETVGLGETIISSRPLA